LWAAKNQKKRFGSQEKADLSISLRLVLRHRPSPDIKSEETLINIPPPRRREALPSKSIDKMGILDKIKDIEAEMNRTQKNKATEHHIGLMKARLAKLRAQVPRVQPH
jgi:hypothetical protein